MARALPIEKLDSPINEVSLEDEVEQISSRFNKGGGSSPFYSAGYYVGGTAYTVKVQAKLASNSEVLGDVLEPDSKVPEEYWVEEKRLK